MDTVLSERVSRIRELQDKNEGFTAGLKARLLQKHALKKTLFLENWRDRVLAIRGSR